MKPTALSMRLLAVGALVIGVTPAAAQTPAGRSFYGVVMGEGLRFGCTPAAYTGKARVTALSSTLATAALTPGFVPTAALANQVYLLSLRETPVTQPSSADYNVEGQWQTAGGTAGGATNRGWATETPGTVAGFGSDPLYWLPGSGRSGSFGGEIFLRGTGSIRELTETGRDVIEKHCAVDWVFRGQERDKPPKPPKGKWSKDPARLWLQLQANIGLKSGDGKLGSAVVLPATIALGSCAAETLCFGASAQSAPELLVRSRVLPGGRVGVAYLPLTASATEAWSLQAGEPAANARSWLVPAAPATGIDRPGFLDLVGYAPPSKRAEQELQGLEEGDEPTVAEGVSQRSGWPEEAEADVEGAEIAEDVTPWDDPTAVWEEEALRAEREKAARPPPDGSWLSTPGVAGFRFKAKLGSATLVISTACPKQTLCLGGTAATPAQLFARVTSPQANGKRWVMAGKFSDLAAQLWVQQGTTGPVRYYELAARPANSSWLPAILDRVAF